MLIQENAQIDLAVFIACAQRGVPIVVHNKDYDTMRAMPAHQQTTHNLPGLPPYRAYDLNWQPGYQVSTKAQERRSTCIVARRLGLSIHFPSHTLIHTFHTRTEKTGVGRTGTSLRSIPGKHKPGLDAK